jgi:hypothetical protein
LGIPSTVAERLLGLALGACDVAQERELPRLEPERLQHRAKALR